MQLTEEVPGAGALARTGGKVTHTPHPPFFATSGPAKPRIVLLGEAWGQSEDECKRPFVGESGKELFRMLLEAMPQVAPELGAAICQQHKYGSAWVRDREQWLSEAGIAMTNVLAFRPPSNKIDDLCGAKKEVGEYAGTFAPISHGKYLREEFLPELSRLSNELAAWKPNLVVALGNTSCWALLQATNIGSIRGAITSSNGCGGREGFGVLEELSVEARGLASDSAPQQLFNLKVLPTYHPAGVLRQWAWRPIVVADLMKAHRESQFPEVRRPSRRILVDPTLEEMLAWEQETYRLAPAWLSPDIETASGQITCIGFARSSGEALVIPFWDRRKPGWSYWASTWEERQAFDCMRSEEHTSE